MTILGAVMGFLLLSGNASALLAHAQEPLRAVPSYTVTLTAYNAVPEQTDENPHETASGAYANPEVVAARSRDLAEELPFGTIIEIDGAAASEKSCGYEAVAPLIGYRVIADTMNARFTDRVDVLFDTKADQSRAGGVKNPGRVLGICDNVTVRVVGSVGVSRMPKTQAELAAFVAAGGREEIALK